MMITLRVAAPEAIIRPRWNEHGAPALLPSPLVSPVGETQMMLPCAAHAPLGRHTPLHCMSVEQASHASAAEHTGVLSLQAPGSVVVHATHVPPFSIRSHTGWPGSVHMSRLEHFMPAASSLQCGS